MQWLISNREPDALYAPVLDETVLRAGVVKDLVKLLPWYKKTPRMETILTPALAGVLRSGFERSFILKQMEGLDVTGELAEGFLHRLEERGFCRFGQPHYFYNQVVQASPYEKGFVVKCQYTKGNVFTSATLFKCLELLDRLMTREAYMQTLTDFLKEPAYAEKACEGLARQGLLLSCNSARPAVGDYGPARWNLDLVRDGRLLDAGEWASRLNFIEDSFGEFFFQSGDFFGITPVRLCGDFRVVLEEGSPAYFWDLSFKLQSFGQQVPVDLTLRSPAAFDGWRELRFESPQVFQWSLTLDLRRDGDRMIQDVVALVEGGGVPGGLVITVIMGREMPAGLTRLAELARLKFRFINCPEMLEAAAAQRALHLPLQRSLSPHLRNEGCGATLSPYIDGHGDVYTCSLEGGACLGNITSGAKFVEQRRRELRMKYSGACRFGVDPDDGTRGEGVRGFLRDHPELGVRDVSELIFDCP
jgi:hypothetical protein